MLFYPPSQTFILSFASKSTWQQPVQIPVGVAQTVGLSPIPHSACQLELNFRLNPIYRVTWEGFCLVAESDSCV